jgi:hypothetical protein
MKMDPAIICRVLHSPRRAFHEFTLCPHYEALLPVVVVGLVSSGKAYLGMLGEDATDAGPALIGLVFVFVFSTAGMLTPPFMNAALVHVLQLRRRSVAITFPSLFTAFVLCSLPLYCGLLLTTFSGRFHLGLGNLFPNVGDSPSLLLLLLGTITPYLLWTVCLWWIAVGVLLNLVPYQRLALVMIFVVLHATVVQILSQALVRFIHLG